MLTTAQVFPGGHHCIEVGVLVTLHQNQAQQKLTVLSSGLFAAQAIAKDAYLGLSITGQQCMLGMYNKWLQDACMNVSSQ